MTDEYMAGIANEYMKKSGIIDTQYLVVWHTDREHPHYHIVFNSVNNFGQTIKDFSNFRRNLKICRDITLAHKLYLPQGKENVNIDRLREPYRTKYEIWQTIKNILKDIRSWEELKSYLHSQNIEINFKYKGTTQEIQGISFIRGKYSFKGSAIAPYFSYSKLDRQINTNNSSGHKESTKKAVQKTFSNKTTKQKIILSNITNHLNLMEIPPLKHTGLLHWDDEDEEEEEIKEAMRRKGRSIR